MALIGNCSNTSYSEHASEITTEKVTSPSGEVQEIKYPKVVETITDYKGIYLVINFVTIDRRFCTECGADGKMIMLYYTYRGYTNKETKDNNLDDFLFENNSVLTEYDFDNNVYSKIYDDIKTKEGLTKLTNG